VFTHGGVPGWSGATLSVCAASLPREVPADPAIGEYHLSNTRECHLTVSLFPGLSLSTSSSSPFFLLHIPPLLQLQFVSCDRGVYTYRADTLVVSLSLDMGTVPTLKLGIKPAQGSGAGAVCVGVGGGWRQCEGVVRREGVG